MLLTETQVSALEIGTRVVFPHGAEAYPDFFFKDRLTGTVTQRHIDSVWIQLHDYKSELAEWNNEIQVWLWQETADDRACYDIELLLSPDNDASLGQFIRDYCASHRIECDGDAFGMVFSETREWSTGEAETIIEMAADIYGLRMGNATFPDLGYALPRIAGFEDTSWGNDVCALLSDTARKLLLWCDYADPAARELGPSGTRFTLVRGEYGNADETALLCASDDIADILKAVAAA